jgi:two-component system, OmpR family, KDP operon response regulator KdpE
VLVIEDHRAQQAVLAAAFEARGHRVFIAATGAAGLDVMDSEEPDLVILDLGLPDVDGIVLCKHLRARASCPIIVVTADSDEQRVVAALDGGADDYVTKPFSMAVLLARARVALRHRAVAAAIVEEPILEAGDVRLDMNGYQVMVGDEIVDMHLRQFMLLALLIRNQGKVITYAVLDRALGSSTASFDERNAWRVAVSKIRTQLGTGPRRPTIHTEHRVGYRLTVPDDAGWTKGV